MTLGWRSFDEAVQPILARESSQLRYAEALIGPGSELLGPSTDALEPQDNRNQLARMFDRHDVQVVAFILRTSERWAIRSPSR